MDRNQTLNQALPGKHSLGEQLKVGIVIGVTVGIFLMSFTAINKSLNDDNERREQIEFFLKLLGEMERVCDFNESKMVDNLKFHRLGSMRETVVRALRGRASQLSFDEIYTIEKVLVDSTDPVFDKSKKKQKSDANKHICQRVEDAKAELIRRSE